MSRDVKYIGMDVHKEVMVIAVRDSSGELVMESIVETKSSSHGWHISQQVACLASELNGVKRHPFHETAELGQATGGWLTATKRGEPKAKKSKAPLSRRQG